MPTTLDPSLSQLENAGLIRQAQLEPELEYIFRHALIQDAAYTSILRSDRKNIHLIAGRILENDLSKLKEGQFGLITQHFLQAEEWGLVLKYSRQAADHFKKMFANQEALEYYQIALNSAEKLLENKGIEKKQIQEETFEILSARHGVWSLIGSFEKERADLEQMTDIARTLKDDARLADALNGLGYFYFNTSVKDPEPTLREALEIKRRTGDKPGEADSLNTLASVLISVGKADEAMQSYKSARQIYISIGSENGIARSEWSIGLAEYELFGNYEQAQALFQNSLGICRKLGMKNLECGNLMMLGANYVRMGQLDLAEATLVDAFDMAKKIGDYPAQGWIMLYQGWALRERGQYQKAMDLFEQATAFAKASKLINLEWYGVYSSAQCNLLTGNTQKAFDEARYIYDISQTMEIWVDVRCRSSALLAEITAIMGDKEQAKVYINKAMSDLEKFGALIIAEAAGVYLNCYKALMEIDPEQAAPLLQLALEKVNTQVNLLSTDAARKSFLENFRTNKEIVSLSNK